MAFVTSVVRVHQILMARIDACLEGKGGETARRGRAAELGQAYLSLSPAGRRKFLLMLARDYGLTRDTAVSAVDRWRGSKEPARALVKSLEAPAVRVMREFVGVPQGVKFVVDLRAELLTLGKTDAACRTLSEDLRPLLGAWFDVAFLDLVRIDWRASASLLEKLVAYEAVHAIRSWRDLKNRLDSDRRCFAFFHPRMPDEPLIFVEVALVDGMAGNVQRLLDARAETHDPKSANTAIFYSISNCQKGLAGITFGNFLIKQVVEEIKRELPNVQTFVTLSPVPGFAKWLKRERDNPDSTLLDASARTALEALDTPNWFDDADTADRLKPIVLQLAAAYFLQAKGPNGRPLDPVARFHLGNGARLERLNFLGDANENGIKQSYGLMVNYLYDLDHIEENHEAFAGARTVVAASAVKRHLRKSAATDLVPMSG